MTLAPTSKLLTFIGTGRTLIFLASVTILLSLVSSITLQGTLVVRIQVPKTSKVTASFMEGNSCFTFFLAVLEVPQEVLLASLNCSKYTQRPQYSIQNSFMEIFEFWTGSNVWKLPLLLRTDSVGVIGWTAVFWRSELLGGRSTTWGRWKSRWSRWLLVAVLWSKDVKNIEKTVLVRW